MAIKGVIFDFNGTLFFDSHYHEIAWKNIAKEVFHRELTNEQIAQYVHGRNNDKIIAYLAQNDISKEQSEKISRQKEAWYRDICIKNKETMKLVDGVIVFFDFLKYHQIPFTIASASIKENIDFFVDIFALHQWISTETIVYDDGIYEDKVRMFQDAAKNIGVDIQDCIVFEDSFSGIQFAQKANAKGIVVVDVSNNKNAYHMFPDILAYQTDFTKMPALFRQWLSRDF